MKGVDSLGVKASDSRVPDPNRRLCVREKLPHAVRIPETAKAEGFGLGPATVFCRIFPIRFSSV